ncbi:MAG TPA: hypothetical protein VJ908_07535 [Wenzhouxiangellaceae bacterium]|nr:hypothetical protein [Wenzhouxiangellaceae bacterium]
MWNWPGKRLDRDTVRVNAVTRTRLLCWAEVLALWTDSESFADDFSRVLAECPFSAFRWETPALRRQDLDDPFEFVLVNDPDLPEHAEPSPFMEHFRRAGDRTVIHFANLGGDADLIVPAPVADDDAYAQLAHFVRRAPRSQQRALWHEVGLTMERRVDDRPVWLNTAGTGVAWVHIRLDEQPKYYAYAPYRQVASGSGT